MPGPKGAVTVQTRRPEKGKRSGRQPLSRNYRTARAETALYAEAGTFSAARVLYEKPLANTVSPFDRQFSRRNAKSRKPGKSEVCGFTP